MAAPPPASPPDEASLHQVALAYLARYAATEAGLRRVLERRIERWGRSRDRDEIDADLAAARSAARAVVARLASAGAVDDAAFAAAKARSLTRAGRSRRAVAAQLMAKGVDAETARAALPPDEATELAAAVALAARRRIGPFRAGDPDEAARRRELGMLARAGFPQPLARRALSLDRDEAEAMLHRLRQG